MSESLDEECKRIDRFVATMHAESMARNEQRRLTLYTQQPSAEYERTALELWAEGATEYARRILRRERLLGVSAAEEVRRAWYELGQAAARMPALIANDAMPPGYKLVVHTNEHGSAAYRWTTPLTEGQDWASPAEALRGAWERTTKRDREGFAELEALMQEINGILRASGRGRDSQTSVSVISEGFAELAEVRGLILATGRTMNNLSAPQVLREVLAEAGEAAQARADLEKLMTEKARPVVTMPTISATPDARDMDLACTNV